MRNPNEVNAPQPRDYLSFSDGAWRAISQGLTTCADTTRTRAVTVAARMSLDISHNWIWNGDDGRWQYDAPDAHGATGENDPIL